MTTKPNTHQSQAPACSHGYTVYAGKHPNGKPCDDAHTCCYHVAAAVEGDPRAFARVALDALAAAGRLPAAHLLPLLDLTADEVAALVRAAGQQAEDAVHDDERGEYTTADPALLSALDKLTTTDTAEEPS